MAFLLSVSGLKNLKFQLTQSQILLAITGQVFVFFVHLLVDRPLAWAHQASEDEGLNYLAFKSTCPGQSKGTAFFSKSAV